MLWQVLASNGGRRADWSCLAGPLTEALALEAVGVALAVREVLGAAHPRAVAVAEAGALELVALRQACPSLRHLRRPHLCMQCNLLRRRQSSEWGCFCLRR